VKIRPIPGSRWPRVSTDGTTFIPRFTATTEQHDVEPRVSVSMDIEVDDSGRPNCLEIAVRSLDGRPVNGEVLRAVPDAYLVRLACATAGSFLRHAGQGGDGSHCFEIPPLEERAAAYNDHFARAKRPARRSPSTQEIEATIEKARREGQLPAQALVDAFGKSLPTAYRWIARAKNGKSPS
jgi:hypothetical protein